MRAGTEGMKMVWAWVFCLDLRKRCGGRCLFCVSIVRLYEEYSLQQEAVPWPLGRYGSHL